MDPFTLPTDGQVPQDLLLIYDIIGEQRTDPTPQKTQLVTPRSDNIDSSDDDLGSESEIEAELKVESEEDESPPTESLDSSSSDSDSEADLDLPLHKSAIPVVIDDDEEQGPVATSGAYFQTKNELPEADIPIPDFEQVGMDETLEKVGEIMSIVDRVVIIRGLQSESTNHAAQRALDSGTLLVFDDRKVMGYIYETFGPTSQPMYQVKFTQSHPIDKTSVQITREVYHVPQRSKFVFLSQIKNFKGSDASNVHDEEPAQDEIEFSDDEAEAAHKSGLRRRRTLDTFPRHITPNLPDLHDGESLGGHLPSGNAYDEHGPYDLDYGVGPSRPKPIPYDDPYSDEFHAETANSSANNTPDQPNKHLNDFHTRGLDRPPRGKTRGRGGRRQFDRGNGRSRGDMRKHRTQRDPGPHDRQQPWAGSFGASADQPPILPIQERMGYHQQPGAYTSPTSSSGPWNQHQNYAQHQQSSGFFPDNLTPYPAMGMPVQPHINPRFASAFGMNLAVLQQQVAYTQQTTQASIYNTGESHPPGHQSSWVDEWTIHPNND